MKITIDLEKKTERDAAMSYLTAIERVDHFRRQLATLDADDPQDVDHYAERLTFWLKVKDTNASILGVK